MSLAGRTRLRLIGACFALLGFGSQYPIPALHRCPVLNPVLYGEEVGAPSASGQADHAALLAALPSCHRARLQDGHAHNHASDRASHAHAHTHSEAEHGPTGAERGPSHGQSDETSSAGDAAHSHKGGGHSHEGCPVCQGFLQLVFGLLEHRAELLSIELLVADRVLDAPVAPAVSLDLRSPGARAPPRA